MGQDRTLKGRKGRYHCDVKTIINTYEFARMGEGLSGNISGEELERADDLLFDHQATVAWSLKGDQVKRAGGGVESYLTLRLNGLAKMICLRCLETVEIPIDMDRKFRIAKDEAHAAKLDSEDEIVDAIVGSWHCHLRQNTKIVRPLRLTQLSKRLIRRTITEKKA
jgi:hypothetical protein